MIRALLACALAGCAPRQQWTVLVTTDARIPSWGDQVLIEVIVGDGETLACPECLHEVPVTADSFPISFGVSPPVTTGPPRIDVQLYRSSLISGIGSLADPAVRTETLGDLPPLPADGSSIEAVVFLPALCFGRPLVDLQSRTTCAVLGDGVGMAPETTLPDFEVTAPFLPGGIDQFATGCATVPAGMACVNNQAFLLGSTRSAGVDSDYPPLPEVALQEALPVLIDVDEMTVGAVRGLLASGQLTAGADELWTRAPGDPARAACTFLGTNDASNDLLPLNCVARATAQSACDALGKQLPGEDQWELAARNGGRGTDYPWGADPPTCDRAIVSADPSCLRSGPVAGGSRSDRTDGGIYNLGGNLSEWVDGIFVPYTDACWHPVGALYDADCVQDSRSIGWPGPWPHRGGSWDRRGSSAAGFARFASPDGGPSQSIGFRCAMSTF